MEREKRPMLVPTNHFSWYRDFIKRFIDMCISLIALIALFIPSILIAVCIKLDSRGPIFFRQQRMGKNDHPFYIYKFRSMYQSAPHQMATAELENAESHITRVGKILRKTSLDELPQLINVLLGQMSLIGPRPLILNETVVLKLRDKNGASKITPGITGLAQVHGRDEITDIQKAQYDGEYAREESLGLDAKILFKTVGDVLHSRGIRDGKKIVNSKPKILLLATTASMIEQFNINNISILQSLGAEVHVATNFNHPGTITNSISKELVNKLNKINVTCHQVDFKRGIGTHHANKIALNQLCKVIKENNITGIHAHSPLGGIIGRRAAHRMHIKIIYTAHGFQFFKGGPLKDWLLFFPVEWFYAHWTDALVTINTDDYQISRFLPISHRYYISGVGTDIERIARITKDERQDMRKRMRKSLGVEDDDYLIISVGELSKRKNHATVIRAIGKLDDPRIKYVIAGIGTEKDNLINLIKHLHLEKQVTLLGYVTDLDSLYFAADLNVFVSTREGLGLGGLDGVAHGLYIIGNGRTGMKDYISNKQVGVLILNPLDSRELAKIILKVKNKRPKVTNLTGIKQYDHQNVNRQMKNIYKKEFLE